MRWNPILFLLSLQIFFPVSSSYGSEMLDAGKVSHGETAESSAGYGQLSLSGWFSTIIGDPPLGSHGEPSVIYTLTDDEGKKIRLLLSEEIARPLGGPIMLDRKRVKVIAVPIDKPAATVRVLSIELDATQ